MPISVNPQSDQFQKVALPWLLDGNLVAMEDSIVQIDPEDSESVSELWSRLHAPDSLFDFLGGRGVGDLVNDSSNLNPVTTRVNIFPFLAYHRVVDKYYKNSLVQCKAFSPAAGNNISPDDQGNLPYMALAGSLPYVRYVDVVDGSDVLPQSRSFNLSFVLFDGVRLGELRQRNFGSDYFAAATPSPQLGDAPILSMQVEDGASSFSIAALRSINAMTLFLERNNLSGTDFDRWLESRGGKPLHETTEPVYLGRQVITMYSNAVTQDSNATGTETQNPFDSVGARYGLASAVGEDTLIDDFEVEQPGYIMVLCSLVPKATYSTGMRRYLDHFTKDGCRADIADSLLEPIGPQPIYGWELNAGLKYEGGILNYANHVFGYIDRYAEFKTMESEVHGLLRDGNSLQSFVLQRSFDGLTLPDDLPEISNAFLQIPTDYLDQVAAVDGSISQFGFWADFYFDYRVTLPLGRSVMPSLIDPAVFDGRTVYLPRANKTL